jgi:hypothetical protein
MLDIGHTLKQYPRLRATRLWTAVRARDFPGLAKQVERYVLTIRPAARTGASPRLDALPGEQAAMSSSHDRQSL